MLSRKSFLVLLAPLLLLGCQEQKGDGVQIVHPATSIEEINAEIRFVGELPSGEIIDFAPSETFSISGGPGFSQLPSTNYSKLDAGISVDVANTFAKGQFEFIYQLEGTRFRVEFQYVLITTFGELQEQFPDDVFFDELIRDWPVAFALGSDQFDINDVLSGATFNVTDYLFVYGIPDDDELFGEFFQAGLAENQSLGLNGVYELSGGRLISNGDAVLFFDGGDFFIVEEIGPYSLDLRQ